jgi:hypothetical protein
MSKKKNPVKILAIGGAKPHVHQNGKLLRISVSTKHKNTEHFYTISFHAPKRHLISNYGFAENHVNCWPLHVKVVGGRDYGNRVIHAHNVKHRLDFSFVFSAPLT